MRLGVVARAACQEKQVLRNVIDMLFYGGYKEADRLSTERVVARYARGNTSIQMGRFLTAEKTKSLLKRGDAAAMHLKTRVERATR